MDQPYRFDYTTLRRRSPAAARPLYLDLEEANRRDARSAGELASPPASRTINPTREG